MGEEQVKEELEAAKKEQDLVKEEHPEEKLVASAEVVVYASKESLDAALAKADEKTKELFSSKFGNVRDLGVEQLHLAKNFLKRKLQK